MEARAAEISTRLPWLHEIGQRIRRVVPVTSVKHEEMRTLLARDVQRAARIRRATLRTRARMSSVERCRHRLLVHPDFSRPRTGDDIAQLEHPESWASRSYP